MRMAFTSMATCANPAPLVAELINVSNEYANAVKLSESDLQIQMMR